MVVFLVKARIRSTTAALRQARDVWDFFILLVKKSTLYLSSVQRLSWNNRQLFWSELKTPKFTNLWLCFWRCYKSSACNRFSLNPPWNFNGKVLWQAWCIRLEHNAANSRTSIFRCWLWNHKVGSLFSCGVFFRSSIIPSSESTVLHVSNGSLMLLFPTLAILYSLPLCSLTWAGE